MNGDLSPADLDAWARTLVAEGGTDVNGQLAVANVVANRLATGKYGNSPSAVVQAKGQFEPWSNGSAQKVDPNSPAYQTALQIAQDVAAGRAPDPTSGATHFYSPGGQQALGRNAPAWGQSKPLANIGGQLFFAPNGPVKRAPAQDVITAATTPQPKADPMASGASSSLKKWGLDDSEPAAAAPAQAAPASSSASLKKWGLGDDAQGTTPSAQAPGPAVAQASQNPPVAPGDASAAVGRGLVNGVPIAGPAILSGLDHAAALARVATMGGTYEDALKHVQQFGTNTADAHPVATPVAQGVGAVLGMAPAIAAAPEAFGMGGGSMLMRMAAGSASGGAIGAADAGARGDNPLLGAGLGVAGGGAGPLAGKLVGAGANKLMGLGGDAVTAGRNYLATGSTTGIPGIGRGAANLMNQVINADDPAVVQQFLAQHGPQAMLADAGPSTTGLASALALKPSDEKTIITNALMQRAGGSNDRIAAQLDTSLGPAEDPNMVARNIEALRERNADPAYTKAIANAPPVDTSKLISALDAKIDVSEGTVKKALVNLRDMLHEPAPPPPEMQPLGSAVADTRLGGPKPESLVSFLQRNGGVQDEGGDLASMGYKKFPGLIRSDGMPMDKAREAAAEAGHLGADTEDAVSNTYISDLLDKLEQHPTYTADGEAEMARLANANAARTKPNGDRMSAAEFRAMSGAENTGAPPDVPKTAAANLHGIRQELDSVINWDAPGLGVPAGALANKNGSLKLMRGLLSDALHSQVPGFKEADANFAALADRQNAVETGFKKVLGPSGPHPDTFAADRAAADPGVNIAQNKGIRGQVDKMFGTGTQRDAVTLNKLLAGGDDGYAAANLSTAFGKDNVNALLDTLAREKAFANTTNEVVQNSATARRTAANKLLEATQPGGTSIINASPTGIVAQAGKSLLYDPLIKMIMESPNAPRNLEMARMMTAQGATRDQIFEQLQRLNGVQQTVGAIGNSLQRAMAGGTNRLMLAAGATNR